MIVESFLQDLRYGFRAAKKERGVTLAAIFALALGLGGSIAIFTVVNAVVLRPLPFPEAEQLVVVLDNFGGHNLHEIPTSPVEMESFKSKNRVFSGLGGYTQGSSNLTGIDQPKHLSIANVTASFFETLRVDPARGRRFAPEEDFDGRGNVVILSDRLWRTAFGADAQILDKKIILDDLPYTVVGVMPRAFDFPKGTDLWSPYAFTPAQAAQVSSRFIRVVARMKPGVELEAVREDMKRVGAEIVQEQRYGEKSSWYLTVRALDEWLLGKSARQSMFVLLAAVAFVLLIACANVANLLLARGVAREREMAIRIALGANSRRIVRQLLTESVLLSLFGGAFGLLIAWWGVDLLLAVAPAGLTRIEEIAIDGRVLGVALLLSVGTGLLFGVAPALKANRVDVHRAMSEGARGSSAGGGRMKKMLVGAQVGLATILLIGAGLMIRSFYELTALDPGFESEGVLTAGLNLPRSKYGKVEQSSVLWSRLEERVASIPGVEAVGATHLLPLRGQTDWSPEIEGFVPTPEEPGPSAEVRLILPGYHRALGIEAARGRLFDARDRDPTAPAVLINEAMARRYYANVDPIGRRIRPTSDPANPWGTIVGVVKDSHDWGLDEPARPCYFYTLYSRNAFEVSLVVRAKGDLDALGASIRAQLKAIDPDLPIHSVVPFEEVIEDSIGQRRFAMGLLILFAGIAALLAAIGIYGLTFHHVSARRQEVGIRLALGADPRRVVRLVIGEALRLIAGGLIFGVFAGLALSNTLEGLLYGVTGFDPLTLVAVAVFLGAVAVLAALFPAIWASRVDPVIALRAE